VTEFPAWGVRKVWAYLKRLGVVVSRKRVWKRMKALGLCLPPLSERAEPLRRGHVAVPESNRRWARISRPSGRHSTAPSRSCR